MKTKILLIVALFVLASPAQAQVKYCQTLLSATNGAATATSKAFPVGGYVYSARLVAAKVSGTNPTLDVHLEHSPDGANYVDVTGGGFTQVTTSDASVEDIKTAATTNVYGNVRAVATLGGTLPVYTYSVILCTDKRS